MSEKFTGKYLYQTFVFNNVERLPAVNRLWYGVFRTTLYRTPYGASFLNLDEVQLRSL